MKKNALPFVLSFFAGLTAAFSAHASLEEAAQALKENDTQFAVAELNRLATEENNADALYQLGLLYEQGKGVVKNQATALGLFERASDGNEDAALKLGNMYYAGKDVDKDYDKAFVFFKKAADKGNYIAQYDLALMIENGMGLQKGKKDSVQAFPYYLKSASQGYYLAQNALGRMYVEGAGTTQNYTRGMQWYRLAADQGPIPKLSWRNCSPIRKRKGYRRTWRWRTFITT